MVGDRQGGGRLDAATALTRRLYDARDLVKGAPAAAALHAGLVLDDARAALAYPAVRLGVVASLLIVAGSFTPAFLPPDSGIPQALGLSWLESGAGRALATVSVLAGVALLVFAWLSLRPRREAAGSRSVVPIAAWWLWSLPFLLAPPLFSRDAYSYAAQGLIVDRGMDPYATGPISVPGPFADQVDPMWLFTSSPYGPLALQTQHLIVDMTFGNAYLAAVAMRLPAIISMIVIARVLPGLAERLGASRAMATWIGVLNPLVLIHLVGGAHNDAMAIALVVVALRLSYSGHPLVASLAIAAAAGYKQTAVLALVGVAGLAARRVAAQASGTDDADPAFRDYFRMAAFVGTASFVAFAAITFVSGLGWGWIAALSVPMSLRSLLAPSTLIGSIGEAILRFFAVAPDLVTLPVTASHTIAMIAMLVGLVWVTLWLAPKQPALATVAAFGLFVLGGPVLHPWYVLPVFVVLGTLRLDARVSKAVIVVTIFLAAHAAFDVAVGNGAITVGLALVVGALFRLRKIGLISFDTPEMLGGPDTPEAALAPAPTGAADSVDTTARLSTGELHATKPSPQQS
ncbi:MAG: polyprenol phosphomannose-dependent alpha 1,6 mannosyltransferase MptB [Dermatophilus congolensis]|nr:polyprenol phosphomannose-dependent alpha 1,6 mannosyltransferase MptB [Dermatophilus congolensis]